MNLSSRSGSGDGKKIEFHLCLHSMFVEREIVKTRNILLAIFSVQFRVINMAILLYLYNTYKHRGEGKQGIDRSEFIVIWW